MSLIAALIISFAGIASDGIRPETPYPECSTHNECPSFGCYAGYCNPNNLNCYVIPRCV